MGARLQKLDVRVCRVPELQEMAIYVEDRKLLLLDTAIDPDREAMAVEAVILGLSLAEA